MVKIRIAHPVHDLHDKCTLKKFKASRYFAAVVVVVFVVVVFAGRQKLINCAEVYL